MLASTRMLFVHIPKTGGTSLNEFFRLNMPFVFFPGDGRALEVCPKLAAYDNFGLNTHSFLPDIIKRMNELFGWNVDTFEKIVISIRNPYDHAASVYFWQRHLALTNPNLPKNIYQIPLFTFKEFLQQRLIGFSFYEFMTIDGVIPKNIHIIRFENLIVDSYLLMHCFGLDYGQFPHLRENKHPNFSTLYDDEMEELVYNHYKHTFDNGYYQRFDGLENKENSDE
jgi:hypothetical protein